MENIYKEKLIFLNLDLNSKDEILRYICNKAKEFEYVSDSQSLLESFYQREKEGTTGFEDGFAIPHAKIKGINQAFIICVRTVNGVEWESLDGKPTQVIIALIIPENASVEHLEILSATAKKLMSSELREKLKTVETSKEFAKALKVEIKKPIATKETLAINGYKGKNIVAITACVVGVAHTYMAEDKLINELSKIGANIRVETQGSKGVGTELTEKEIANADVVIIAADTKVNLQRFNGKLVYSTHVARAIKEPLKVLEDAFAKGTIQSNVEFKNDKSMNKQKEGVLQHIFAGISYMIPVIIGGGICLAFSIGLAKAIWGPEARTSGPLDINGKPLYPWNPLAVMDKIGGAAFTLMIPILAGFIANSIAGRAAIAPAMLGAFIGNNATYFMPLPGMPNIQTPTGFVGAILSGLLVGYYVRWVNTWKVHKSLKAAMPIFFIPLTAGIGISVLFIYLIGGPIGYVMQQLSNVIKGGYENPNFGVGLGIALGILIGAMASFDMGGPINKIAFVTCTMLIDSGIYYPMGTMAAAIPVAPLGMGLSTILFKRFFNKEEKGLGIAAMIMGTIGISEGAIPFAIRDPKRAIAANIAGGVVAGAIAGAFKIQDLAGHGGPIVAILGAVPYGWQTAVFFLAVTSGVAVTTSLYGLMLISSKGTIGSLKETHANHIEKLIEEKSSQKRDINDQIRVLRSTIKVSKSEQEKNETLVKIEKLKSQKTDISKNTKEKIIKAIEIFDQLKKFEKDYVNQNKEHTKNFIRAQKEQKMISLKNKFMSKSKELTTLDHYDKKIYLESYSKSVEEIKENYQESILNYQIKLRKKFTNEYNEKVK
ncbi:fructose-specific PTS transporter subunit EIIC [Spiroplasma floricola]|uniref:PTS system, fructose-specific IIA component n=1 Tax=Spiroplasma floricola 23-6 TaxID=1336749 RepID=A0A2K8SDM7_9MOLU|nr:fructose-specific PTS transporter subunit EIIC [Spiroplasma floricola]AUB31561.1 PTS system, fructose-specific IIA component [Spiroplasma floricola 23-6]